MKRFLLTCISTLFMFTVAYSQPITYTWSESLAGSNNAGGKHYLEKDAQGNIYIMGQFTGNRSFGSLLLTAQGSVDIFVAKYSPAGTCLWAVRGGAGFSNAYAGGLAINGSTLFITGYFSNFLNLGSFTINSNSGYKDVFVAGLSTTDGTAAWLDKAGGSFDDLPVSMTPAASGGFYICGTYTNSATFGNVTLTTSSILDADVFFAKYSATGTCLWAKKIGGFGTDNAGGIKETPTGDIIVNGGYEDLLNFDNGTTLTSVGSVDFFLAKFNSVGIIIWAVSGGSLDTDLGNALDIDGAGNIYSTGIVGGNATFGPVFIANTQNLNVLTLKHNSSGVCQWARMGGDIIDDMGLDITADPLGSCYTTGYVTGNPNFGAVPLSGVQGSDGFVVKYNTIGTLVWLAKVGGSGTDYGKSILFDNAGSCYVSGDYNALLTLGTTPPLFPPAANISAIFLTRINGGTVGLADDYVSSFTVFPNPAYNEVTLNLEKITDLIFTIDVLNIEGKILKTIELSIRDAVDGYELDVNNLSSGSYFIRINSSTGEVTKPLMIQRMD